jgi:DNA-directed RNA polymerase subunit RPC12/RpoP
VSDPGVEIPSWELECSSCGSNFTHSKIEDAGILNYLLPVKPEFPPGGSELDCPNCGHRAIYQRADLTYHD